jgi:hypothetical protein
MIFTGKNVLSHHTYLLSFEEVLGDGSYNFTDLQAATAFVTDSSMTGTSS